MGHFLVQTRISLYQNMSILDFVAAKNDGGGGDTCGHYECAKHQSNRQQINIQFFTGRQIKFRDIEGKMFHISRTCRMQSYYSLELYYSLLASRL